MWELGMGQVSSKAGWGLRRSLVRIPFHQCACYSSRSPPLPLALPSQSPEQGVASRGQNLGLMWSEWLLPPLLVMALT